MYLDGAWREIRDPQDEEAKKINGEAQKLGFGEFAEYTYVEVLKKKPKYAAFPSDEGLGDRAAMKKFAEWVEQKEVGIIADTGRRYAEREKDSGNIHTVGVEFGFLVIHRRNREENIR